MEPFWNIRIPWCLLVEPGGENWSSWQRERDDRQTKTLPLFKMGFQLFFFVLLSFEDLEEWGENLSRWDSTAQNFKSWCCWVEFLCSQLSKKVPDSLQRPSWASGWPPPHLPQWFMCNITSECECKHFHMKRIDFCHWHGILMIGNNILIDPACCAVWPEKKKVQPVFLYFNQWHCTFEVL